MTEIICKWLNTEVKLSRKIEPTTFSADFSSGFLLGELLFKFGLQNDFDQFSQNRTSDAKLNNFTRIEPALSLLEVSFDTNIARDVMNERPGAAARLLYEMFVTLSKKQKKNLTAVAMETMRPAAPVKLDAISSIMYKERLKHMTPRQTDLELDGVMTQFHQKQLDMEKTALKERFEEQERCQRQLQEQRLQLIRQFKEQQLRNSETLAKIRAAEVHLPKLPPSKTAKAIAHRRQTRKQTEAKEVAHEIAVFEARLRRNLRAGVSDPGNIDSAGEETTSMVMYDEAEFCRPAVNEDYINKVRKRLNDDVNARAEREKRRRKVLVEQLTAHDAQEEARREDVLVNLCMRQSIQERRIAVQLMQVRHEKDVIRQNRLDKEKQFEDARIREFEEALDKDAELIKLYQMENEEQIRLDREQHERLVKEREMGHYGKHYDMCADVVSGIVDMSTKIAEYREFTNKLLPEKLIKDWMELFVNGEPLYEPEIPVDDQTTEDQLLADERTKLLNDTDFNEYRTMTGEWVPPEVLNITAPPRDNPILGHVVHRILQLVCPVTPQSPRPVLPPCPIKICLLGKTFSGKSSCCRKLAEAYRLEVLKVDVLVAEAIDAFKSGETSDESSSQLSLNLEGEELPNEDSVDGDNHGGASRSQTSIEPPKPSRRAELGGQALSSLTNGEAVSDQLLVNIITAAIEQLSEGTGWVLDGFPTTMAQAVLLEKALSGYDAIASQDKLLAIQESSSDSKKPMSKSSLVSDPRPLPPLAEPKSGIDLVILLDLSDDVCLERAAASEGESLAEPAASSNQQVASSMSQAAASSQPAGTSAAASAAAVAPPAASAMSVVVGTEGSGGQTGSGIQLPHAIPARDTAYDKDQMQQRILTFDDEWQKLEKWFNRFEILRVVEAAAQKDEVEKQVEELLENTLKKLEGVEEEPKFEFTPEELAEPKPAEPEKPVEPVVPATPPPEAVEAKPVSARKRESRLEVGEKKKGESKQRLSSPKAGKKGGKDKKGKKEEAEAVVEEPTGPPPPQPGSDEWQFVDRSIDLDLAQVLAQGWETVETSYIDSTKKSFCLIRNERDQIIRYLYDVRRDFVDHINRPDHKQEFVSQWQKDFNCVPDDMRLEPEVRADLHQRVDDARERLWSISDERKEQAETERAAVMANGWLEDHLGLLDNHYITLMQSEVDRFQDTVAVLRDYYTGMEGRVPEESIGEYARVPLVELPETVVNVQGDSPFDTEAAAPAAAAAATGSLAGSETELKQTASKPVAKKQKSIANTPEPLEGMEEAHKSRIPLIQRRTASPEAGAKVKLEKTKGAKTIKETEELPPVVDVDERLLTEVHSTAVTAVDKITSRVQKCAVEAAVKEADEEAERQRLAEDQAAAKKNRGKKPGGKDRAQSPKKGKDKESPSTPAPGADESQEAKQKRLEAEQAKLDKERGKQEFYAAVAEEAAATKLRLDVIKAIALSVLQDLKSRAEATYNDLNDWIGVEFLQEMESIEQLCEVMRHAVEAGEKINEELVLHRTDLVVSEDVLALYGKDVKLLRTPSPPAIPEPVEESLPDMFTIDQLRNICNQFSARNQSLSSPLGVSVTDSGQQLVQATNNSVIPIRTFQETMQSLMSLSQGVDLLPALWLNLSMEKLDQITSSLTVDNENIDWRRFLLQIAQPWPMPTETELLDALERMREMDQKNTGYITKEQFERVELWLQSPTETTELMETPTFDRLAHLRPVLFDILADHTLDPPLLDYVQMLMYFSVAAESYEGFLRALSVATSTHMPRVPLSTSKGFPSETQSEGKITWPDDVPESAIEATVPLDALYRVLCHGQSCSGDSNRLPSSAVESEEAFSRDRLIGIYEELSNDANESEELEPLLLSVLLEHPVVQEVISACTAFKAVDLRAMMQDGPAAEYTNQ